MTRAMAGHEPLPFQHARDGWSCVVREQTDLICEREGPRPPRSFIRFLTLYCCSAGLSPDKHYCANQEGCEERKAAAASAVEAHCCALEVFACVLLIVEATLATDRKRSGRAPCMFTISGRIEVQAKLVSSAPRARLSFLSYVSDLLLRNLCREACLVQCYV